MNDYWSILLERRFFTVGKKLQRTTNNSMENRGSTPILTNIEEVYPGNIHTKMESKYVQQFKRSQKCDITY